MTLNLRALIREVANESSATDPQSLTKEVLGRIPKPQRAEALEQALFALVSSVVTLARGHSDSPGGQGSGDAHLRSAAGGHSSKVAGIRAAWQRRLRERLCIGPAPTDWKFLGDCTSTDLRYAATDRRGRAASLVARADEYEQLADALDETGADMVRALPDLAARLGDAA